VDGAPDLLLEPALENGYSYVWLPSTGDERASLRPLAPVEYVAGKGGGMNGSHHADGLWAHAGPAVPRGMRAAASITDVAPTVLHLAGLPVPSWMDGRVIPGVAGEIVTAAAESGNTPTLATFTGEPSARTAGEKDELWRRLVALGYLQGAER